MGWEEGERHEGGQGYELPITGQTNTGNVRNSTINAVNTAVPYVRKLLREQILKALVTRKTTFFYFFVYPQDVMDVL